MVHRAQGAASRSSRFPERRRTRTRAPAWTRPNRGHALTARSGVTRVSSTGRTVKGMPHRRRQRTDRSHPPGERGNRCRPGRRRDPAHSCRGLAGFPVRGPPRGSARVRRTGHHGPRPRERPRSRTGRAPGPACAVDRHARGDRLAHTAPIPCTDGIRIRSLRVGSGAAPGRIRREARSKGMSSRALGPTVPAVPGGPARLGGPVAAEPTQGR